MPELPEVETIARTLRQGGRLIDGHPTPPLLERTFQTPYLLSERSLDTPSPAELQARLPGQRVTAVDRRGKFLVLRLSRDALLVHLRMSGDLIVVPPQAPLPQYTRFYADLDGGLRLAFDDARKFGRLWLVADPEVVLRGLGPEPLGADFTPAVLLSRLRAHRRMLKPLLLDQSFLAGLGNIYADEALFLAHLHPLRTSDTLSPAEAEALWGAIRHVLEEGIRHNGASIDWAYRGGQFQNNFRVYQRSGQPCPVCGTPIARIVVAQRGTHFCPTCQPENPG